jgi:hypothetical protein
MLETVSVRDRAHAMEKQVEKAHIEKVEAGAVHVDQELV